ncbi:MAG: hypothetical protein JSS75_01920 [Bacteroidetes bacterium]|nr:hypothetical protein [Bacteroidota bacterium]
MTLQTANMTTTIQISTPVLPNQKMADTLTERIKTLVTDGSTVKVIFYQCGFDSYGLNSFDVLALDTAKHELTELRNSVMVELFTTLFHNSK